MRQLFLILTTILCLIMADRSVQAADPPCEPSIKNLFSRGLCAETVLPADPNVERLESHGIVSISGLAFGSDGVLYFARPATSEILRLVPDGKGRFLPPQLFASKLPEPPNGLAYDPTERAWYVSADTTITRLRDRDADGTADDQQVIVRDLPGEIGGWLGNIRIGPDRRLYVAKASSCDTCTQADSYRGVLLSFALDGSDMRIVARGLRDAYDFDWNPADGKLYIADNERSVLPAELNALPDQIPSGGVSFGWPHCDSRGQRVGNTSSGDCGNTIPAVQIFDPGSHPTGMMFYRGEAFPDFRGKLLVLLSGSLNTPTISGYEMMIVSFADGKPGKPERLLPNSQRVTSDAAQGMTSFYPYHMTAIAISPEGWIYVSIAEGRIYRFRPAVP